MSQHAPGYDIVHNGDHLHTNLFPTAHATITRPNQDVEDIIQGPRAVTTYNPTNFWEDCILYIFQRFDWSMKKFKMTMYILNTVFHIFMFLGFIGFIIAASA